MSHPCENILLFVKIISWGKMKIRLVEGDYEIDWMIEGIEG